MTAAEARTELKARGFDYLTDARIDYFLLVALMEILENADWPFLQDESTGTMPMTLADLRTIESVEDVTNGTKLQPRDRRELTDAYNNLSQTGTSEFYYRTETGVDVYPRSSGQYRVRYWEFPSDVTSALALLPARYHYGVIEWAVAYAYEDNDEYERAQAARQAGERVMTIMTNSLLSDQHDRPKRMTYVGGHGDD